jgi:uncharacterized membrane protein HdeD (DUF308 family)
LALFWPGLTLVTLVYIFAAYILVSGIVDTVMGFTSIGHKDSFWLLTLLLGIAEVAVGVYMVRNPSVSFTVLVLVIGFTFLLRGVVEIVAAFMDKAPDGANRTLLVIAGLLGIVAGVFTLRQPVSAGVAFVWVLGLYALVVGPMQIARATAAKRIADHALDEVTA